MTLLHPLVVAIATILLAAPLSAQGSNDPARPVVPGDTVRLREDSVPLVQGLLIGRDSTALIVADRRTRDTVHVTTSRITRADVQRGSHRRGASAVRSGAAVGGVIGGVFIGFMLASPENKEMATGVEIGVLFTAITTGIGAAVGAIGSFTETETWVTFDPAAVPVQASGLLR